MRILLSNHSLFKLGGSETWLRTMYNELVTRGHTVHVFTPIHQLWPDIPDYEPTGHYDLALINHSQCLEVLKDGNIDRIIFTSHGIIPQPEWPTEGADVYVSVSEETQASNLNRFQVKSVVIRNPINTALFKPIRPTADKLKRILFLSNYGWTVMETLGEGTAEFEFQNIGGEHRVEHIEHYINWADLIVGLGRSAYEGMSCARNVIVYDYMGADGIITPETIFQYREKNCSGRTNRIKYTVDEFREELGKYDPEHGPALRDYILEHNNVEKIADQYLSL